MAVIAAVCTEGTENKHKHFLIAFSNCIVAFGHENLIINNNQQVMRCKIKMLCLMQLEVLFCTYCKLDLASAHDVVKERVHLYNL